MKHQLFMFAALSAVIAAPLASAADGTINFNGELVDQTCTVDVDGVVSPTAGTVTLPTISAGLLPAAGMTEGRTSFKIGLSNCVGAATNAAAFFDSGASVDPISGNLNNVGGTASNVQLQLFDIGNDTPIQAGFTNQLTSNSQYTIDGTGNTVMPYAVQYYATGAATPGTVVSSVTFNIDYQ